MESAIDRHLQCPRTLSRRAPDDYRPPFPIVVARASEDVTQVVMAYVGVQYRDGEHRWEALEALRRIVDDFALDDGPGHHDTTEHRDAAGYDNLVAVGYWRDPAAYRRWRDHPQVAGRWESDERIDGLGFFREVVAPRVDRFETLYPFADDLPGVGAVMDGVSGEVSEHAYWGSMRDRVPRSQTDRMAPDGTLTALPDPARPDRVVVRGHDNVALIRSGQDWSRTEPGERELYLHDVEPELREAMDFLRDRGERVGCYSNRYVRNIDLDGHPLDQTYAISHWRSLDRLERWAESHPTHLSLFVAYVRRARRLPLLRLYHEVSVVEAADQSYEYVGCHPATGMLRDAESII
ncbi:phenylacetaldoxime dehydratase [Actinomycetospora sp. NBRC 106375]|uniref:aliphatic aldoxime dehydratase n=1 Tax=Actinomycetospora sp. NBRC 106375 TaxID=3032207 RepID=UPI0024A204A7|nr:phenylacetaldoxime dehydratase family protein [Actinomycetospora sp. NBRC 106375]GLZ45605.1 phenylacetaldoxime dehydratase [Actinomycetospora sp. NBRC 106375]